jgi:hypothetical protein
MTRSNSPVRILGLVRMMNSIRKRLACGISADQKDELIQLIASTVSQVDTICRQHKINPDHLPKPSFFAYQYLKSVDLQNIQLSSTAGHPSTIIKVSGIVRATHSIQQIIFSLAEKSCNTIHPLTVNSPEIVQLYILVRDQLAKIDNSLRKNKGKTSNLPESSQRAYQWLKYLESPRRLLIHINGLSVFLGEFHKLKFQKPLFSKKKGLSTSIKVNFYNISALYKSSYHRDCTEITLHEGFIRASPAVKKAIITCIFSGKSKTSARAVKMYANSAEFCKIALDLSNTVPHDKSTAQGNCYNLYSVFDRVNDQYFLGKLTAPHIVWNNRPTWRKFGHYIPASNTVMISISLDTPSIRSNVIDFVMYHELLHCHLGLKVSGSKIYAHTAEFRAAERQFIGYKEAQDSLNVLARSNVKR